jgi:hypothetical protein
MHPLSSYTNQYDICLGISHVMWKKKKVVGLERGPLSLVTTTEGLLNRKVAALV